MTETEPKRLVSELLKHPMANVVVGFLLTGVIGGALTNYYTFKRTEQTHQQALIEARKETVTKLISLNAEHIARAKQLLSTFEEKQKPEDFDELKGLYEAARIRWQTESSPALLAAREVLPAEVYYEFRKRIQMKLQARFLDPLHACMSEAKLAYQEGRPAAPIVKSCGALDIVVGSERCIEGLMDMLYELAGGTIEQHDREWFRDLQQQYQPRLDEVCNTRS